jgi:hypothetical protein
LPEKSVFLNEHVFAVCLVGGRFCFLVELRAFWVLEPISIGISNVLSPEGQ